MRVLITVDTELSTARYRSGAESLRRNMQSAIYGGEEGRFGLSYQLETLDRHGLKAVFFLESLCADVVGFEALDEIAGLIRAAGQDIQLHVHPEWLRHYPAPLLRALGVSAFHDNVGEYPLAQQTAVLKHGLANLAAIGVRDVNAFRAGNFGADANTLAAAAANGLEYDSSYSVSCADDRGPCQVSPGEMLTDCRAMRGVVEVPVTFFDDKIFGPRHLQLCSISLAEMRNALTHALAAGRETAVIVSHSFELLNRARARAHGMHVSRFQGLCRFLAERRGEMPTATFGELDVGRLCAGKSAALESSPLFTLHRMGMQLVGRLYG